MNDLKNGILDINGFLLGPNTTVQEIEEQLDIVESGKRNWKHLEFSFVDSGITFKAIATFDCNNNKLWRIELRPQFPEIASKYDLAPYSEEWLPYFKELRTIMDEWLFDQLGEPSYKDSNVTEYEYKVVLLGTAAYIDEHSRDYRVVGGVIDIIYR